MELSNVGDRREGARRNFHSLVDGKLPNRHKTVKQLTFAGKLSLTQNGAKRRHAEAIGDRGRRAQEGETAEASLGFPIAHGQILGDAFLALEPGDRLALAAEGVDEL